MIKANQSVRMGRKAMGLQQRRVPGCQNAEMESYLTVDYQKRPRQRKTLSRVFFFGKEFCGNFNV